MFGPKLLEVFLPGRTRAPWLCKAGGINRPIIREPRMDRGITAVLRIDSTSTEGTGGEAVEKYLPGQRQTSMNESLGPESTNYLRHVSAAPLPILARSSRC